mgnify:CR=1 FL=1
MEKTVNIENFIGIYDGFILPEDCKRAIDFYENQNKFDNSVPTMTMYLFGGMK